MERKLAGTEVTSIRTLGSWFDNGCVMATFCVDGEEIQGRLSCNTILKMMNEFEFTLDHKVKYTYLTEPEILE